MTRASAVPVIAFCAAVMWPGTHALAQAPATPQTQSQAAGVVIEVAGTWTLKRTAGRIAAGQLIYAGDAVITPRVDRGGIAIAMFESGQVWRQNCSATTPCEGPYTPPAPAPTSSGLWAFVSSYWRPERPFPPVFAAVRSGGTGLSPSIVQSATRIDLQTELAPLGEGTYRLELSQAAMDSTAKPAATTTASVAVGEKQPAWIDGPKPGLYVMVASDSTGRIVGGPTVLFIAIDAATARRRVNDLVRAMNSWTGMNAATRDQMIIRALYALADAQAAR